MFTDRKSMLVDNLITSSEQTGFINSVYKVHSRKLSCGEALLKFTSEGSIDNPDVEAETFLNDDARTLGDFKVNPRNAKI
jgi:hypothetical protein